MVIDELKDYGVDIETALMRCANNEALYIKLINKIPAMTEFDELKKSIENKDFENAFSYAHALKGIVAGVMMAGISAVLSFLGF